MTEHETESGVSSTLLNKANFSDLKIGDTIKLESGETFVIDKIFAGGYVDMTATKPYHPESGLTFHQKFMSIPLVNFEIVAESKTRVMTDSELNMAEEAIELLAQALDVSQRDIINVLEDGFWASAPNCKLTDKQLEFLDEMRATFDAY